MRAFRFCRVRRREIHSPSDIDLEKVANQLRYVGSPEHKDIPTFTGQPKFRGDAAICPRGIERQFAEEWLRTAVLKGATGAPWEGELPRYVWYKHDDSVFEARLVNRGNGSYKGYPLGWKEWPPGIEILFADA